jgi:uncharacterized protein (DUF924 family)
MTADQAVSPEDILTFWRNAGEARWWAKDDAFDNEIRTRFMMPLQASLMPG